MSFQIVNNANEIILNEGWVNATNFKSHGRVVNEQGRKVNADYQYHKYRIIAKQERYYSVQERIERICQGIWAVITTWGRALQSKSTIHLFTKSKETVHFGVIEDHDHFSTLPPELLIKIFNMLSIKDRFTLSQICKHFTQAIEAYLNTSPLERLFYKNIKSVQFAQENPICNFLIRNPSEDQPELVITSDSDMVGKNPVVKLWASNEPPVTVMEHGKVLKGLLAIGGKSSNLLATTQNYLECIQIWDLEKQKVSVTKGGINTIDICLYAMEDVLWIGFPNGKISYFNISDLSKLGEFQAHSNSFYWISGDPTIARLFTQDHNNILKIWDTQNLHNPIKEISKLRPEQKIIYNSQLKCLIGANTDRSISIWKAENGTAISNFFIPGTCNFYGPDELHFNAERGLFFAIFRHGDHEHYANEIFVWDVK